MYYSNFHSIKSTIILLLFITFSGNIMSQNNQQSYSKEDSITFYVRSAEQKRVSANATVCQTCPSYD